METLNWQTLPKQAEFLRCSTREVLYSGAFGSGKTRAVCMKLVMRASKPGAREGLCRKHLSTLKNSTLKTLLEPEGDLPPVLPPGVYTHNKAEKEIRLSNGGVILYFGLDDEGGGKVSTKRGSMNLSGCAIDQAEELSGDDYRMLRGRIRLTVKDVPNQIYSATNPDAPTHHLAVRFGLDNLSEPANGCSAIVTASADNFLLPEDYLADLDTFTGLARKRYVLGQWAGAEGLIYDAFDRQVFVRERNEPWKSVVVGVDWGFTNPSALLAICVDERGALHIADEFYKSGQLEPQVVREAERMKHHLGASVFVADPSAAALRETMTRAGLNTIAGNNDVLSGIMRVQKRFVVDGEGRPGITISPKCTNLIREVGMYEWMEGKDKPRKENDHACDALRYGVMHVDSGIGMLEVRLLGGRDEGGTMSERFFSQRLSLQLKKWSSEQ